MATIDIFSDIRVWLEYSNFVEVPHALETGRIGRWNRATSNGYVDETLLTFDLSALAGATINSCDIVVDCDSQGVQVSPATGRVVEQDQEAPIFWSDPPVYLDFLTAPGWPNELAQIQMQDIGVYTFLSTSAMVALVQSWVDDSADNWGVVVTLDFGAIPYYLGISDLTKLVIDYDESAVDDTFHGVGGGVREGVNNGVC